MRSENVSTVESGNYPAGLPVAPVVKWYLPSRAYLRDFSVKVKYLPGGDKNNPHRLARWYTACYNGSEIETFPNKSQAIKFIRSKAFS